MEKFLIVMFFSLLIFVVLGNFIKSLVQTYIIFLKENNYTIFLDNGEKDIEKKFLNDTELDFSKLDKIDNLRYQEYMKYKANFVFKMFAMIVIGYSSIIYILFHLFGKKELK